jgi:hypothetical protein
MSAYFLTSQFATSPPALMITHYSEGRSVVPKTIWKVPMPDFKGADLFVPEDDIDLANLAVVLKTSVKDITRGHDLVIRGVYPPKKMVMRIHAFVKRVDLRFFGNWKR